VDKESFGPVAPRRAVLKGSDEGGTVSCCADLGAVSERHDVQTKTLETSISASRDLHAETMNNALIGFGEAQGLGAPP